MIKSVAILVLFLTYLRESSPLNLKNFNSTQARSQKISIGGNNFGSL